MARINIEDLLWSDPRYKAFEKLIGDEDRAIGQVIRLWRLGQEMWKIGKLISMDQWEVGQFSELLIKCKLAEFRPEGVYVKGSTERFDWLRLRREAGRKGGKASAAASHEENQQLDLSKTEQTEASPSFSRSPSFSSSFSSSVPNGENPPSVPPKHEAKSAAVWERYEICYRQAHGKDPKRNREVNSLLCKLVDNFGKDDAVNIVAKFFAVPNAYYEQNFHPVKVLIKDAHTLYGQLTTGKVITKGQARQMERSQETRNQMERIENGEV